jgi:hypothetical protein
MSRHLISYLSPSWSRVKTKDWARPALSLLESIAKVFGPSKLTSYLNISGTLLDGIEGFIGLGDEMQFRLGQRDVFSDSETRQGNLFKPSYFVNVRDEEGAKKTFWVKEDQL